MTDPKCKKAEEIWSKNKKADWLNAEKKIKYVQ